MVAVYNKNASNQGISPNEMSASVGNLLVPTDPSPADFKGEEWFNFDLAVVGLGFHHFEDPALAATRLAERLKPGGVLLIIDFMPHEHHGEIVPDDGGSSEAEPSGCHGHGHGHGLFHGHGHGREHKGEHNGPHGHGEGEPMFTPESTEGFKKVMGTIAHAGFAQDDVQKAFETAGVGKDFGFDILNKDVVFRTNNRKITRQVFFARGTKA
jgi:SAM-dependent methyltransferase